MKNIIIILLALFLASCTIENENETRTLEWISKAQKPIVCKKYGTDGWGKTSYTLIDTKGNVFNTGRTELALPDTIRALNKKEEQ